MKSKRQNDLKPDRELRKELIVLVNGFMGSLVAGNAAKNEEHVEIMKRLKLPGLSQKESAAELITREDTSKRFKLSLRSVDRLRENGYLTPIRVGRRAIRFNLRQVQSIIEGGIICPESAEKGIPAAAVKSSKEATQYG